MHEFASSSDQPVNILLAEDHMMFSEMLADSLAKEPHFTIVDTVRNGDDAIKAVSDLEIDLILMDVRMKGGEKNGIEAAKEILRTFRNIKIIMISAYQEGHLVNQAFSAGIHGYLLKGNSRDTLLDAIDTVLNKGGMYYRGEVKEAMDQYVSKNRGVADEEIQLTPTQLEILQLLASGMNSREIADARNRKTDTIIVQRRALLQKFNARNVAELIKEAIRRGFLDV